MSTLQRNAATVQYLAMMLLRVLLVLVLLIMTRCPKLRVIIHEKRQRMSVIPTFRRQQ